MFYEKLNQLCKEIGRSPYGVCTDIGLNRSAVAKWRAGAIPTGTTITKLARYFGVSVGYLLGTEETAQSPVTEEDIKFALFGGEGPITDQMYQEVKQFAAFVKQRELEKKE